MSISIRDTLAAKGIHPSADHLEKIEKKWQEIELLKGTLEGISLDDADISLKNIAGGDHHE